MSFERLEELLIDRALVGLDADQAAELRALLAVYPEVDPQEFDLLAGEVQAALVEDEPLPSGLRDLIEQTAPARPPSQEQKPRALAVTGWLLAAAGLIYAFLGRAPITPSTSDARSELIASAADLVRIDWTVTEDEHVSGKDISGDVVWSGDSQEGYVRLEGFPVNDPSEAQYQLWIFDGDRDKPEPISAGVFDVNSEGELILALDAGLDVSRPTLFAVTLEEPGGVVVPDQEHVLLIAPVQ